MEIEQHWKIPAGKRNACHGNHALADRRERPSKALAKSLSELKWAGRMEEVLPGVWVDGAHNISAVEAFAETAGDDDGEKIIVFLR